MSIEEKLHQKAAEKEAEEARKRTEEEHRQSEQQRLTQEAERLEREQAEVDRLEGLRKSITGLDEKTAQMQSLLTELHQTHEQASASAAEGREEKEKLTKASAELERLFGNEEFRKLLAEEGINSVADLLKAEGYSDKDEVIAVKKNKRIKRSKVDRNKRKGCN
jgi:chromosome segregation ATPase